MLDFILNYIIKKSLVDKVENLDYGSVTIFFGISVSLVAFISPKHQKFDMCIIKHLFLNCYRFGKNFCEVHHYDSVFQNSTMDSGTLKVLARVAKIC